MGATLLGALTALHLDLVIAFGARLLHPTGQEALIQTTVRAGLTGLLCWVVCALITRAISGAALKPYNALADHLERLADGEVDGPVDQRGPVPGVRRLSRAVVALQQRPLAIHRSEAGPQLRYDSLYHDPSERRLLMEMLVSRQFDPDGDLSPLRSSGGVARAEFEIPRGLSQSRTPQTD